ncbi:LacI family DNA-binding transcriptional regulator [Brachybacterium nesterenkovii]|uniref:LacI family DNA-binding transcriptional regulator n=1 Tax=Brachybacterium nesterenkovii TaxID=47847 RepID=UPI00321A383F
MAQATAGASGNAIGGASGNAIGGASGNAIAGASGNATIYAVAQRAGVSTATVSRALAGSPKVAPATRDAVLAAARELAYVPDASARALAGRRTGALGLVLPHIDGAYYAELLVGFEMAASRHDLSVTITLANPRDDSARAVRELSGRVDGMAFMARSAAGTELVAEIARRRPVITVAREQVPGLEALFAENRETARDLTRHLLDHGRTRPVFVGRPEAGSDLEARHQGYCEALAEAGVQGRLLEADLAEDEGSQLADRLLADRRPDGRLAADAIVCGNDELALTIMTRLQDQGVRVPEEVAITGWDDTVAAAYVRPGLTSVAQPVRRLGELAAARLALLVDGEPADPGPVVLPSTPVFRTSCGCTTPTPRSAKELS